MARAHSEEGPEDYRETLAAGFRAVLFPALPRILSQLDRDPDSPTFGCFDRHHWHYKIRDFPSAILQQGMLVLDALSRYDHEDNPLRERPIVREWIDAAMHFWAWQQLRSGAFNEYYPYEEGYPPTAFSLNAVTLVFRNRGFPTPDRPVRAAIQRACNWLLEHPEREALNQEAAGLAALANAARIPDVHVDQARLDERLDTLLAAQSPEGWFPEYGGADLGYLSVTIDCLWDIFELTEDEKLREAIGRAVGFLAAMVTVSHETPVMTNSRNSDYVVPYGLVRAAEHNGLAAGIVRELYRGVSRPDHFLRRTDDRYCCHYVYPSCFRALPYLGRMAAAASLPCEEGGDRFFHEAGVFVRHQLGEASVFVAGRKGGVVSAFAPEGLRAADYGWRRRLARGKVAVTHWQDPTYEVEEASTGEHVCVTVRGRMTAHGWLTPTPFRHFVLRVLSRLFGRALIPWLKKALIFRRPATGPEFERRVLIAEDGVRIEDTFFGPYTDLERAPKYSLRHVSSAGQFTRDELTPPTREDPTVIRAGQRVQAVRTLPLGHDARRPKQ